jgi:hypothetical protein
MIIRGNPAFISFAAAGGIAEAATPAIRPRNAKLRALRTEQGGKPWYRKT